MAQLEVKEFVISARIAAHLYFSTCVAQGLSLTAKNARAIAVRAGEQAIGFRAITDFIEELASDTIAMAEEINLTAMAISKTAVSQERALQALARFKNISERAPDATYLSSIADREAKTQACVGELNRVYLEQLEKLSLQLEEVGRHIRSACVLSATSKVEASQAGRFRQQLEVIAYNIERSADEIQQHLKIARDLLYGISSRNPRMLLH